MTNTISVSGGGNVILCINGVESTESQIAAIRPQDIEKIEYHDNPGLRYAGAAVVIDYITCRHNTGGNLSLTHSELMQKADGRQSTTYPDNTTMDGLYGARMPVTWVNTKTNG